MACKSAKGSKKEDASLTLDAITALFQQYGEDLKSEFKSSVNMLSSKLDQVRQAQEEQAERVSSLELATEDLSQRVAGLEDSCAALREDNAKLKDKVTFASSVCPKTLKAGALLSFSPTFSASYLEERCSHLHQSSIERTVLWQLNGPQDVLPAR